MSQASIGNLAAIQGQDAEPFVIGQLEHAQSLDNIRLAEMRFAQVQRLEAAERQYP